MISPSINKDTIGLMTVKEAGLYLNLKTSRIRSLVFKGEIPAHKLGATVFFIKSELEDWIMQLTKGGSVD